MVLPDRHGDGELGDVVGDIGGFVVSWHEEGFEKVVWVEPAFERLDEGYGIGSCRIVFALKGPLGAVQFMIGTDWYVPSAREHLKRFPKGPLDGKQKPTGWDVGCHSLKPMYEDQPSRPCNLVESGECYYDGSGLLAEDWIEDFVAGGTNWLWPKLRQQYADWLENPQDD